MNKKAIQADTNTGSDKKAIQADTNIGSEQESNIQADTNIGSEQESMSKKAIQADTNTGSDKKAIQAVNKRAVKQSVKQKPPKVCTSTLFSTYNTWKTCDYHLGTDNR